ncbi:MAG: GDP-mannose 4,6-dehydratase [candidate division Zixibacteria bacterium]|nr:GDP-mannose 4,6-dehydratase [candidate division Zixibacteria bacterium]
MKILITGIAGFVGSHLAERLLKTENEIFGICLPGESLENIRKIRKNLHLSNCDITRFDQLSRVVKRINPDQIYHLAALSSVGKSFSHPLDTIQTNIRGTLYLLETVRNLKKRIKILVVGSSDMYGKVLPKEVPITENKPLLPISPYGMSKAACDLLAYQYFASYGVYAIRARAFNHTGPRQSTGFVIPDFASQIAEIEAGQLPPILKVGNLSTKRDISDVRDVVRAYVSLMGKGKAGEAYNICSQEAYSIRNVLKILLTLSKKKIKVGVDEAKNRPAEIPILVGNNAKIRKTTGWKPKIPVKKTLEDTLNFWRRRVKFKYLMTNVE